MQTAFEFEINYLKNTNTGLKEGEREAHELGGVIGM
jgi:hypothetical protein